MMDEEDILVDRLRELSSPLTPLPTNEPSRLSRLRQVKAVLFDVYGTLFISGSGDVGTAQERTNAHALVEAFTEAGYAGDLEAAAVEGERFLMDEIGRVHAEKKSQGIDIPEVDICEVWRAVEGRLAKDPNWIASYDEEAIERLALEYEARTNPVWPMPQASDVVTRLKKEGTLLGIVSNAQFYTPMLFDALLNESLSDIGFDEALCTWSYELGCAKPSPRMFEGVLATLRDRDDIHPGEVVYVGNDMLNDVWTASRAGCQTVLFAGDQRSLRLRVGDERCEGLSPDAVITELRELLECLGLS